MTQRTSFNADVAQRLHAAAWAIFDDIPEVDALCVGVVYGPGLDETTPQCFMFSRKEQPDPGLLCRAGVVAARLVTYLATGVSAMFRRAQQSSGELTKHLDAAADTQADQSPT